MQKRLTSNSESKNAGSKKVMPITYQVLEEFIANENYDLNRQTSIQLNNRNKEEQLIDMEEIRFAFFVCVTYKKYNHSYLHLGLSVEQNYLISSIDQQNHCDQLLKLLDCFQTAISNIRQRMNGKVIISYITELTIRILFSALNPTHDNNKSDGINNLRCQYLAKEIDPPIAAKWHFQIKSSTLSLLVDQIFEYYQSHKYKWVANKNSF